LVERIIDFLEIQHIRKMPVGQLPYASAKRRRARPRAWPPSPILLLLDDGRWAGP